MTIPADPRIATLEDAVRKAITVVDAVARLVAPFPPQEETLAHLLVNGQLKSTLLAALDGPGGSVAADRNDPPPNQWRVLYRPAANAAATCVGIFDDERRAREVLAGFRHNAWVDSRYMRMTDWKKETPSE